MVANTRGRIPVRAAKPSVELLEGRTVPSAAVGETGISAAPVAGHYEYHEGYEYGDGTGIGWATGGFVIDVTEAPVVAPEPPAQTTQPDAPADGGTAVYLNGEQVAVVRGEPALAFLAPTLASGVGTNETIVYVNGQPVGTVTGTPTVAAVGPVVTSDENGKPVDLGGAAYFIGGTPALKPDQDELDLSLNLKLAAA